MSQAMKVFAEFPAAQILPLLNQQNERGFYNEKQRHMFQTPQGEMRAKINTKRLRCFAANQTCVTCGLVGTMFRLETDIAGHNLSAHLNMYAQKDDEYILMTRDHIIPLSRGGPDHMKNLQTMCAPCNEKKGSAVL